MAGLKECLEKILTAVYGKDVRQAIHDGIKECGDVANQANSAADSAFSMSGEAFHRSKDAEVAVEGMQDSVEMLKHELEYLQIPDISDKTVSFTEHAGYEIASGEKVSVLFGKIRKLISVIKSKAPHLLTAGRVPVADRLNHQFEIDGLKFDGSKRVKRFIACSTAADVAAKSVDVPDLTVEHGSTVRIRFFHGNTAENPTLNVNGSGAFPILYLGQPITADSIPADAIIDFMFLNDSSWKVVGVLPTNQDQLQSDWNQTDQNAVSFVKNKPDVKAGSGKYSVDAGYRCSASGIASFTEGSETEATQSAAHAEGFQTKALGQGAHSEGVSCTAGNNAAHAENLGNQANGTASHAEGYMTVVGTAGTASHAEGLGTTASSATQHVEGRYNREDSENKYAHIVGNGAGADARSNAYTLDWQGNARYAGDVVARGCGGDAPVSLTAVFQGMKELERRIEDAIGSLDLALQTPAVLSDDSMWCGENDLRELRRGFHGDQAGGFDVQAGEKYRVRTYVEKLWIDLPVCLAWVGIRGENPECAVGCNQVFSASETGVQVFDVTIPEGCTYLIVDSLDKAAGNIEVRKLSL